MDVPVLCLPVDASLINLSASPLPANSVHSAGKFISELHILICTPERKGKKWKLGNVKSCMLSIANRTKTRRL